MFNLKFVQGSRRWVILFMEWAIKFPSLASWVQMLAGFRENLEERAWWCTEREERGPWQYEKLAEIIWADRFGFIVIMRRCRVLADDTASEYEIVNALTDISNYALEKGFKHLLTDLKYANVGIDANGVGVRIDYGHFGGTMDCYVGLPNGWSFWRTVERLIWKARRHFGSNRNQQMVHSMVFCDRHQCRLLASIDVEPFPYWERNAQVTELLRTMIKANIPTGGSQSPFYFYGVRRNIRSMQLGDYDQGGFTVAFYSHPLYGDYPGRDGTGQLGYDSFMAQVQTELPSDNGRDATWGGKWQEVGIADIKFLVTTDINYKRFREAISPMSSEDDQE